MERFRLDGKAGIVTGAAQGLGEVFAGALAEAGADLLIVTDRQVAKLEGVARRTSEITGRQVVPLRADVTVERDVREMVEQTHKHFGRIDFIVNNAGIVVSKPALELSLEEWRRVIEVNLTGVFLCSREVASYMIRNGIQGSIINISSGYGEVVDLVPNSPYYASKAGVIHLSKALACEWGRYGIRVNVLCPGWFPTPMGKPLHSNRRWVRHMCSKIPLGRLGEFDDLKPIIVFMASDASAYISGHVFEVLGGPVEVAEPVCTGLKYLGDLYGDYVKLFDFPED